MLYTQRTSSKHMMAYIKVINRIHVNCIGRYTVGGFYGRETDIIQSDCVRVYDASVYMCIACGGYKVG